MLFYYLFRTGLWRRLDREKLRFFFGWTEPGSLSRQIPPWRHLPWGRALLSPRTARSVCEWLRYRVDLFDGRTG
jgi:hypothetical protein